MVIPGTSKEPSRRVYSQRAGKRQKFRIVNYYILILSISLWIVVASRMIEVKFWTNYSASLFQLWDTLSCKQYHYHYLIGLLQVSLWAWHWSLRGLGCFAALSSEQQHNSIRYGIGESSMPLLVKEWVFWASFKIYIMGIICGQIFFSLIYFGHNGRETPIEWLVASCWNHTYI